jgi:hypothetical protein
VRRDLADLKPDPANARLHSSEQIDQIAASMRQFGWTMPMLIDEKDAVIAGHGRLLAARRLGWTEGPCAVGVRRRSAPISSPTTSWRSRQRGIPISSRRSSPRCRRSASRFPSSASISPTCSGSGSPTSTPGPCRRWRASTPC